MCFFRPEKIDFNSLKKEEPIKNLNIAFECAEQEFDIAPLLDAPGIDQLKHVLKPIFRKIIAFLLDSVLASTSERRI